MAFSITTNKETAIKAFIHEWLKDPEFYCNSCGNKYYGVEIQGNEMCCDRPQIGTNKQILAALVKQNEHIKKHAMFKDTGANKDNTFRWGLSLPPRLLHDLEQYCAHTLGEPFLRDTEEMHDFMRAFPFLMTCNKV